MKKLLLTFLMVAYQLVSYSLSLTNIVSDHMVLQSNSEATIWGWATAGNKVIINPGWGQAVTTTSNSKGEWSVKITTCSAGGPYSLTVSDDSNTIVINDILIGEVWICSGQSNMDFGLANVDNGKEEVLNANYPNIRWFKVGYKTAGKKCNQIYSRHDKGWREVRSDNAAELSAVAYYFGKELHQNLDVPIGLICTGRGATPAETWMGEDAIRNVTGYADFKQTDIREINPHKNFPTASYNAMLYPLIPYTIKGVIWYQGEANTDNPDQYKQLLPLLIRDWRSNWQQGDFPFYYAQIAPFNYGPDINSAELREAQLMTMACKNVGMAVLLDIGNASNIHPTNKLDVGKRLALWALNKDYGKKVVYSGPLYKDCVLKNGKAHITFDYLHSGLVLTDSTKGFELAGSDKVFKAAVARVRNDTLEVWSDQVNEPLHVRYAWQNVPEVSLFNKEGLPASSFRNSNMKPVHVAFESMKKREYEIGDSITVKAFALNATSTSLYLNDILVGVDSTEPLEWGRISFEDSVLKNLEEGFYNLKLVANDAFNNTAEKQIVLKVGHPHVNSIEFETDSVTLYKTLSSPLKVLFNPSMRNAEPIIWATNDTSIAKVDSLGFITGISEGSATITATTKNSHVEANCLVNVEEASQTPYFNEPFILDKSLTIEAEYFDKGVNHITYYDDTPGNEGNKLRTDVDADIEKCEDGGYNIGWFSSNEWMEYTLKVMEPGNYNFSVIYSSLSDEKLEISFNDSTKESFLLNATGNWQLYNIYTRTVKLEAGTQILRVKAITGGINLNNYILQKKSKVTV